MRGLLPLLVALATPAAAEPLTTSPVPKPRPGAEAPQGRIITIPVYFDADVRPRPRPSTRTAGQVAAPRGIEVETPSGERQALEAALAASAVPRARPQPRTQSQPAAPIIETTGGRRAICGSRDIFGARAQPVRGRRAGCGISNPVRVTSVAGVPLSRAALMNCTTAKALRYWVENGVKPGVGRLGGGPGRINVVADYACRTINHRPGANLSEHAKGNAIDISGITLKNGTTLSLERDWRRPSEGAVLRRLHRAACGPFGTVLGPDADRFHQDHFHFDTKRRRNPYCR
ncbi:MAG: extensin family protein [Pseudomonadota bacterium]